jgi:hypothetical protein
MNAADYVDFSTGVNAKNAVALLGSLSASSIDL